MRPIPQIAVAFVADHEGFRSKAYLDSANIWTIGFGHIEGVKQGDTCTKAKATLWLAEDMQIAQQKLYGVVKSEIIDQLTESQWAALLSFAFNLGAAPSWTIWKLINARKFDQAANEFPRFNNAGGVMVQGLVRRRAEEQVLWHRDDASAVEEAPPSAITRLVGVTPPTPATKKPLWQSKTLWAGGTVAAGGVVQGAQTVQGIAAPQAYHSPWVAKIVGLTSLLIVIGGALIVLFKMLEQRAATHQ